MATTKSIIKALQSKIKFLNRLVMDAKGKALKVKLIFKVMILEEKLNELVRSITEMKIKKDEFLKVLKTVSHFSDDDKAIFKFKGNKIFIGVYNDSFYIEQNFRVLDGKVSDELILNLNIRKIIKLLTVWEVYQINLLASKDSLILLSGSSEYKFFSFIGANTKIGFNSEVRNTNLFSFETKDLLKAFKNAQSFTGDYTRRLNVVNMRYEGENLNIQSTSGHYCYISPNLASGVDRQIYKTPFDVSIDDEFISPIIKAFSFIDNGDSVTRLYSNGSNLVFNIDNLVVMCPLFKDEFPTNLSKLCNITEDNFYIDKKPFLDVVKIAVSLCKASISSRSLKMNKLKINIADGNFVISYFDYKINAYVNLKPIKVKNYPLSGERIIDGDYLLKIITKCEKYVNIHNLIGETTGLNSLLLFTDINSNKFILAPVTER